MKKNVPIIKKVVLEMGGTIEDLIPERGCFFINLGGKRIFIERKITINRQSFASVRMSKYKDITYHLLRERKLPTPQTECFYKKSFSRSDAAERLKRLEYPIIIKNSQGSNSRGIFPLIKNSEEAVEILENNLHKYPSMIAQNMVFGKEFRLLVLDKKIIGALEMVPPYVVGNGKSTVKELIEEKQKNTERKTPFDEKLDGLLDEKSLKLESVLLEGEKFFFKKNSSLAEGGEMEDFTGLVNSETERVCAEAAEAVGKALAGIDVICEDVSKSPSEQSFNIIEINGKPDLYIHYEPVRGEIRDVVKEIVEFMAKNA